MEVKKIVKLTNDQYSDLLINGEIIVDGEVKHWEDDVLYISDSALETVELRNMIDKGLIKPNKLSHTQYITPKVKELIQNAEYPDGYLHIPDYEWNYVIIKGKMTNGDYFKHQPTGTDAFGNVMIWNNAEWQELENDYECTTDNEEDVMLKVYAPTFGYSSQMKLSRNSFKLEIVDLGLHTTSENINGSRRYSNEIDMYDLLYITTNFYLKGNFQINDTLEPNSVTNIEIDGYLNDINWVEGFGALIYFKAKNVNSVSNLNCNHIKRFDTEDFIPSWTTSIPIGYSRAYNSKMVHVPKVLNYANNSFMYIAYNSENYKDIDLILNYPCYLGQYSFQYGGFNNAYLGEDVTMNTLVFSLSKIKKAIIKCKNISGQCFYNSDRLNSLFLSNTTEAFNTNSFNGCSNLINVELEEGFNATGLNLSVSSKYSINTMLQWIAALKDNSGTTAKTLQMGTTNWNKFKVSKISYADDLGRWEFDTGYVAVYGDGEITRQRVSGRPQTLNNIYDFTHKVYLEEGVDYTYEDGYVTFTNPVPLDTLYEINYTTTATMTSERLASSKNWNIS